jgi:hypothetical protein
MKHQPSEKLKLTDAQPANDKQVARQELKSGANTGPRGTSPPKKSTPVKQDHGAGAASAPEGARLKRTLATAPFLVMRVSDVHLMVRDEPVVVHMPREVPDVRTIWGNAVEGPSYRYRKSHECSMSKYVRVNEMVAPAGALKVVEGHAQELP